MARILHPQSALTRSDDLRSRYANWLDWNFKNALHWSLWFLFMGVWFAVPVLRCATHGGHAGTPVIVLGAHDTSFTAPLLWVTVLMAVSLLLGIVLLLSCVAIRRGWLKP